MKEKQKVTITKCEIVVQNISSKNIWDEIQGHKWATAASDKIKEIQYRNWTISEKVFRYSISVLISSDK